MEVLKCIADVGKESIDSKKEGYFMVTKSANLTGIHKKHTIFIII